MSCANFIGTLFLARDVAHSTHLNTRSYSKHKALKKFYDGVIDLADKFAEAYQKIQFMKEYLFGAIPQEVLRYLKYVGKNELS